MLRTEKKDDDGRAALGAAIAQGNFEMVARVLNENKELGPSVIGKYLRTVVKNNRIDLVELLLTHGANPDQVDAKGNTLLHQAVLDGNDKMVEILLKYKADPDWPKPGALFQHAVDNDYFDIIKLLIKYHANTNIKNIRYETRIGWFNATLLFWATWYGYNDIIYALKGTDLESDQHNSLLHNSPLEIAAFNGKIDTVKALLAIGVDPNYKSDNILFGTSPLISAIKEGRQETVEALLEYGADPAMQIRKSTYTIETPLLASLTFPKITELLNIFGTDANKAKNHLAYLLKKGYALEDLPYTLQAPYPELLKTLVIYTIDQRQLNVLNDILKKYKKEKLSFLNDPEIMGKIIFSLEQNEASSRVKLSIIEKLKLLTPDYVPQLQKIEEKISLLVKDEKNPVYADLFNAVDNNNYAKVESILKANPLLNLNVPLNNSSGVTLLDFSYSRMLSYGEVKSSIDPEGKITFEKNLNENKKIFLLLLKNSDVNAPTVNGQSLFHIAVIAKAPLHHLVLFLLQGANLNLRDEADKKPVAYMLDKTGHLKDDELKEHKNLLENGIDYLLQSAQKELLESLLEKLKKEGGLYGGLYFDYFNTLLIRYLNKPDINGNTWFHRSLINNETNLLESPWINYIDPNIKNSEGFTVLDLAIRNEDFALVNLLLEKGAVVNEHTFDNVSCLKHFNYLFNTQGHTFESLLAAIKNPYPLLLKVMVDRTIHEGRIDILNAIASNYSNEQLTFLKEPLFIQKIQLCLGKVRISAPKHYKADWPIVKKLHELNPADKQVAKLTKMNDKVSSKPSEAKSPWFLLFSKMKNAFSTSQKSALVNPKSNKHS